MWHKEEIESALNDLRLLNKAMVNVSSLRRIENVRLMGAWLSLGLLEESLSHTLVDDNKSDLWKRIDAFSLGIILVSHDLLELIKLELDDLLAHGVTNTITVDEDVIWKLALIVVAICLKSASVVLLQDVR